MNSFAMTDQNVTNADVDRFSAKVLMPIAGREKEDCWLWMGARHSKKRGYGKFRLKGKCINAHKAAYVMFVGPVEAGQVIGHQCNNEFCVSPFHLKAETQTENMIYCVQSGRHNSQK